MRKVKNVRRTLRSQRRAAKKSLMRRMKKTFPDRHLINHCAGEEGKMSEVLQKFIEPYRDFDGTEDAYRKLTTLAVVAWNIMLIPEKDREGRLGEILLAFPEHLRNEGRAIIVEMMNRKERLFAQHRRMILGFELTDMGNEWHLSVASTANTTKVRR